MAEPIRLVALTGRSGAGKDSVAATLVRHLNYQSIAFADALRAEIAEAWRIDARMLADPATKEWPLAALAIGMCCDPDFLKWHCASDRTRETVNEPRSPRAIMQRWGDFKRQSDPDHYAGIVVRWLRRQVGTGWTRLVVTDLRFKNELAQLQAASSRLRVVRVHRPGLTSATRHSSHASETEMARVGVDHELINGGDLAALVRSTLAMEGLLYA